MSYRRPYPCVLTIDDRSPLPAREIEFRHPDQAFLAMLATLRGPDRERYAAQNTGPGRARMTIRSVK